MYFYASPKSRREENVSVCKSAVCAWIAFFIESVETRRETRSEARHAVNENDHCKKKTAKWTSIKSPWSGCSITVSRRRSTLNAEQIKFSSLASPNFELFILGASFPPSFLPTRSSLGSFLFGNQTSSLYRRRISEGTIARRNFCFLHSCFVSLQWWRNRQPQLENYSDGKSSRASMNFIYQYAFYFTA